MMLDNIAATISNLPNKSFQEFYIDYIVSIDTYILDIESVNLQRQHTSLINLLRYVEVLSREVGN